MFRARRAVARHPIASFLAIGNGVYFAAALTPPLAGTEITRFDLPVYGSLGTILSVGLAAFVVTAAADGRVGVDDLVRRCLRWRLPVRWYLLALFGVPIATTLLAVAIFGRGALESPPGGWTRVVLAVLALWLLQLVLFNFAEEIGWTGFFQHRLQDRYGPLKLSAVVASAWAVWHLPDFFVEEGWTLTGLALAPVFLAFEVFVLFFARVLIIWLYVRTGRSVLMVGLFHAGFNATISELAREVIPASNGARLLVVISVIVFGAGAVIVATRGRFSEPPR